MYYQCLLHVSFHGWCWINICILTFLEQIKDSFLKHFEKKYFVQSQGPKSFEAKISLYFLDIFLG